MNKFKDLSVYQKALELTKSIRSKTASFPKTEMFGLTAQFRRAGDSIVLNIAEGAGDTSPREFARFLVIAIRSGFECLACCDIAVTNEYMRREDHSMLSDRINEIIAMLNGLRKSVLKR